MILSTSFAFSLAFWSKKKKKKRGGVFQHICPHLKEHDVVLKAVVVGMWDVSDGGEHLLGGLITFKGVDPQHHRECTVKKETM